jgi:hypothetical protein
MDEAEAKKLDCEIDQKIFGINLCAYLDIPHYSTDITAAFKVVDHLCENGFWFKCNYDFIPGEGAWAYFDWKGCADARPLCRGNGKTIPEAICRAALMTLDHPVPSDWQEEEANAAPH